jgi:anaerobic magnesium-protoporphyrin IX monomethyl ester cyclase
VRVLFVEPPKDIWFVMGEYLPPPFGLLQLAAYAEREVNDVDIKVLDCNAQKIDWKNMEAEIAKFQPDVVASSALATCNTYLAARTLETAKKWSPSVLTVAGGQHFTSTAQESIEAFPEIDIIVRGEGEQTLAELLNKKSMNSQYSSINGISFKHNSKIRHNPPRPFIKNLDDLPYPGYHFVKDLVHKYHFSAMAGMKAPYSLIEGSRGCPHRCTYCSQWSHWMGTWRKKSPKRVADEMEYCYDNYGSRFIWLTDDNFGFGNRAHQLANKISKKDFADDLMWFTQARCDDVVKHEDALPKLRKAGLQWVLLGVESASPSTLETFKKSISPEDAEKAVKILQKNDIFAQAMFIIGEREDSAESIKELRDFANKLDPDFAIFAILTPFPGTDLYGKAREENWIEDFNWANYDMVHAVMPTEKLTRKEIQEELYKCYRSFYGSWGRRFQGIFSRNKLKRRIYWYMLRRGIINQLKNIFQSM